MLNTPTSPVFSSNFSVVMNCFATPKTATLHPEIFTHLKGNRFDGI